MADVFIPPLIPNVLRANTKFAEDGRSALGTYCTSPALPNILVPMRSLECSDPGVFFDKSLCSATEKSLTVPTTFWACNVWDSVSDPDTGLVTLAPTIVSMLARHTNPTPNVNQWAEFFILSNP